MKNCRETGRKRFDRKRRRCAIDCCRMTGDRKRKENSRDVTARLEAGFRTITNQRSSAEFAIFPNGWNLAESQNSAKFLLRFATSWGWKRSSRTEKSVITVLTTLCPPLRLASVLRLARTAQNAESTRRIRGRAARRDDSSLLPETLPPAARAGVMLMQRDEGATRDGRRPPRARAPP